MQSKSTDFSRWWGVGAKAPHNFYSTNEVGGLWSSRKFLGKPVQQVGLGMNRNRLTDKRGLEATDEVGGYSLEVIKST